MGRDDRKKNAVAAPAHSDARPLLGIDPGLQRTGYALLTSDHDRSIPRVLEAGVIRLNPKQALEQRLLELERSLESLIAQHRPVAMAVEQLYAHYKHPRTAIIMGHARGVILALAARAGLNVIHVAATHVKKHLTGSGHASKAQVQRAVAVTLHLPCIPEPNDVADALAVAFCGLQIHRSEPRSESEPERQRGASSSERRAPCPTAPASTLSRHCGGEPIEREVPLLPSPKLPPNLRRSPNTKPRRGVAPDPAAAGGRP